MLNWFRFIRWKALKNKENEIDDDKDDILLFCMSLSNLLKLCRIFHLVQRYLAIRIIHFKRRRLVKPHMLIRLLNNYRLNVLYDTCILSTCKM